MPYASWRTVDAPLTDSRILAMESGDPILHLIIWPTSRPGTRYYIEQSGRCYLTVTQSMPTVNGRRNWTFMDHNGAVWDALTKDSGVAEAATLTRRAIS